MKRMLTFAVILTTASATLVGQAGPDSAWRAAREYPPLVFSSKATLDCEISSAKSGRQSIKTVGGQGFTFSAEMQPIKDGTVRFSKGGMDYKFDAFPIARVPTDFTGLGRGLIVELKVEVEVRVKRFKQSGGPGTTVSFTAPDIDTDGAYVEFTGVFVRDRDGKRFPFRTLFGSSSTGQGKVTPAGPEPETSLAYKRVQLGTAARPALVTTTLFEQEDDVPSLK